MTIPLNNSNRATADAVWAAEQLGLDGPLDFAAARGKLWRQLRAHELLPPADWQVCARVALGGAPAEMSPGESIVSGRRDALREQVETFAAQFFRLPPDARRAQWEDLMPHCRPHAPLVARLESLAVGLEVDLETPAAQARPEIAELRQEFCRLFVLRPHRRALALQAFRERTSADRPAWEQAAQMLETWHADVAALNKPLVLELKQSRHFDAEAARRKQRLLATERQRKTTTTGNHQVKVAGLDHCRDRPRRDCDSSFPTADRRLARARPLRSHSRTGNWTIASAGLRARACAASSKSSREARSSPQRIHRQPPTAHPQAAERISISWNMI